MATRAAVIYKGSDGMRGVYSHWDGYLSGLGPKLKNHFNTRDKVERLIEGGDIAEIDDDGNVRYFNASIYKGETWQEVASQIPHNGHIYVSIDGIWHYAESTKQWLQELDAALDPESVKTISKFGYEFGNDGVEIDDVHDWISGKVGGGRDD